MPSAIETLIQLLKTEKKRGCDNGAAVGGFGAYSTMWRRKAHAEARRQEHHVLAEEVGDILRNYEDIDSQVARMKQIDYVLDRLMGRKGPPADYVRRIEESSAYDDDLDDIPPELMRIQDKPNLRGTYGYDTFRPIKPLASELPTPTRLEHPPRRERPALTADEAQKRLQRLKGSVTNAKGIGPSKADELSRLDIYTIEDMLFYLPRRFDDYTQLKPIYKLEPGEIATVIGTVQSTQVRAGRNGRKDFAIVLSDGTKPLAITFFGQHFLVRSLYEGQQIVVSGKTSVWRDRLQMTNPEWERLESENLHTVGIVPVYGLTEGVTARAFRRLMKKVVDQFADQVPDYVPQPVLERTDLADLSWTIQNLHFPSGWDHLRHAQRRYLFNQLLLLQLAVLATRREWQAVPGESLTVADSWMNDFLASVFPYTLTGAQQRALAEIRADMAKDVPMNRLLQGDVGAGKTAVAVAAMGVALQNGYQAALMAPTSVLAEQHYRGISASLDKFPGELRPVVALLTGALSKGERESIYRGMADGSIDVVIGTHALIQEGVAFQKLGVAIIDEQHRFGVEQRGALRGKGTNPHLLVMTATPIPRTLALTMYADLDLSILDEKPPGRQPVETRVIVPAQRETAFRLIDTHLEMGRQAFIVHPLVEASENIEARAAIDSYDELETVFHRYRLCLLHGRMRPSEKDEVMAAFANHEYDVMVTTSVAEVGVDVPNASIIMIEGANRFGLAQLHQFRGRVGRGEHRSFCLLVPDSANAESNERLQILTETNDGFVLAEKDWELRGAGDLLGRRQSGLAIQQLAEVLQPDLVQLAQQEARTIYEEDPRLEQERHALLKFMVESLHDGQAGDIS